MQQHKPNDSISVSLHKSQSIDGVLPQSEKQYFNRRNKQVTKDHINTDQPNHKKPIGSLLSEINNSVSKPVHVGVEVIVKEELAAHSETSQIHSKIKTSNKLSFRRSVISVVQYISIAAVSVLSAYSTNVGQWFVLAYALFVLLRRQNSQLSFAIAIFILISVPFFHVIKEPGVANNMAVYVYELFVIAIIQALIELNFKGRTKQQASNILK